MDYYVGDGYLTILETLDCKYEVAFDNRLGQPITDSVDFTEGNLYVVFDRREGRLPDTMIVIDGLTGITYGIVVDDGSTGKVCVPWPLVG